MEKVKSFTKNQKADPWKQASRALFGMCVLTGEGGDYEARPFSDYL